MISCEKQKEEKRSIICVIDIDDFKKLNDVYGHITGDKVLKSVASIFLKNIRSSDFIARIGGEEFIVILHDVIMEEARLIIDKLREKISNTQFLDYSENNKIKCTISGGIDEIQKNDSLASAVDRADKNLYKAKNSGKNMIIS